MEKLLENKSNRRKFFKIGGGAALALAASSLPSKVLAEPQTKNFRRGFLIDLRKCIGCKACSIACKTEFDVRLGEAIFLRKLRVSKCFSGKSIPAHP